MISFNVGIFQRFFSYLNVYRASAGGRRKKVLSQAFSQHFICVIYFCAISFSYLMSLFLFHSLTVWLFLLHTTSVSSTFPRSSFFIPHLLAILHFSVLRFFAQFLCICWAFSTLCQTSTTNFSLIGSLLWKCYWSEEKKREFLRRLFLQFIFYFVLLSPLWDVTSYHRI